MTSGATTLWNATAGARVQLYRCGLLQQRKLSAKVISIGNLAWGGTGKTPFTLWLAQRLLASGVRVSILTRGYRRNSSDPVRILPPGTPPEQARDAGDEVQIYLRRLQVPIGIAASRYEAGHRLETQYPLDVHLLDDGFQHLGLWRDLDFVLLDAAKPWGRPGLFPPPLREAPSALRRADAILLTRCELASGSPGDSEIAALKAAVGRFNPAAPCFALRTRLLQFRDQQSDGGISVKEIRGRRPFGFCGIGHPESFLALLSQAGIAVAGKRIFPDHHQYRSRDLSQLNRAAAAAGADCLLTTEKDLCNLPDGVFANLPTYWAAIELLVEEEARLLGFLHDRLQFRPTDHEPASRGAATAAATSRTRETEAR